MTICPKCGAGNHDNSWRCKGCYTILKDQTGTTERIGEMFQTRIRQAADPQLSTMPPAGAGPSEENDPPEPIADPQPASSSHPADSEWRGSHARPAPKTHAAAATPIATGRRTPSLPLIIAAVGTLMVVIAAFFILRQEDRGSAVLFAQGEQFYNEKNHDAALPIFKKYVEQFPAGQFAAMARERVSEINDAYNLQQTRIAELLLKANSAFRKTQFLFPENDNVILYTRQTLALDPQNVRAYELQAKVVNYYEENGDEAMKRRRYRTAIQNYEKILAIIPDSPEISDKLERARKRYR